MSGINRLKEFKSGFGFLKPLMKLADEYMPEILCIAGIVSDGMALVSAFKASERVHEINVNYDKKYDEMCKNNATKDEFRDAKITRNINYIRAYKWALLFEAIGAGCSIASNRVSGAKIAGLTTALVACEDKLKKGAEKIKEKFGDEKAKEIFSEIHQEAFGEKIKHGETAVERSDYEDCGETPFYDPYLDSLIWIPEKIVNDGIYAAKEEIKRNHILDFNKWRGFIGLPDCGAGKDRQWNPLNPFDIEITEELWNCGWKVKVLNYKNLPSSRKV